jgi:hypothetical protein
VALQTWDGWRTPLILVRPEIVIRWHRQGLKLYWRWRSRAKRPGRPRIPPEHIEFIRRMSRDHPTWGEDKIDEELRVKFAIATRPAYPEDFIRCGSTFDGVRVFVQRLSAGDVAPRVGI